MRRRGCGSGDKFHHLTRMKFISFLHFHFSSPHLPTHSLTHPYTLLVRSSIRCTTTSVSVSPVYIFAEFKSQVGSPLIHRRILCLMMLYEYCNCIGLAYFAYSFQSNALVAPVHSLLLQFPHPHSLSVTWTLVVWWGENCMPRSRQVRGPTGDDRWEGKGMNSTN